MKPLGLLVGFLSGIAFTFGGSYALVSWRAKREVYLVGDDEDDDLIEEFSDEDEAVDVDLPFDVAVLVQAASFEDLGAMQALWERLYGGDMDETRPMSEINAEIRVALAAEFAPSADATRE